MLRLSEQGLFSMKKIRNASEKMTETPKFTYPKNRKTFRQKNSAKDKNSFIIHNS